MHFKGGSRDPVGEWRRRLHRRRGVYEGRERVGMANVEGEVRQARAATRLGSEKKPVGGGRRRPEHWKPVRSGSDGEVAGCESRDRRIAREGSARVLR